ncbi:hypothetical protein Vretimale_15223 [Volvox reticuliferus]|uniref:Uncharacterized protein n=1 Tax=Volvox reticuliferus TaxID=1737510 RepID=A0A8J4LW36_9CHLO|nr:hypothetical protein Vretifemale_5426 [Volvox reticuliferus]GIM11759.1 hypothetical protein Vretimale_15223 [Volvox reticuliferus]
MASYDVFREGRWIVPHIRSAYNNCLDFSIHYHHFWSTDMATVTKTTQEATKSKASEPIGKLELNLPGPYIDGQKPWFFEASEEVIAVMKARGAALMAEMLKDGVVPSDDCRNCCDSDH